MSTGSRRPGDLVVVGGLVIPAAELVEQASRSSGPGGQHVNKTNTRVTLRWNLETSDAVGRIRRARLKRSLAHRLTRNGELVVHAGRHRSRARNRDLARERLAELVARGVAVQRARRATKPTKAARSKTRTAKLHQARRKQLRRRVDPDKDS